MRRLLLLLGGLAAAPVLYLASCSEGPIPRRPSRTAVERLEQRLAQHSCVRPLGRWQRHYTFVSRPFLGDYVGGSIAGISVWRVLRWYDYGRIDFDYQPGNYRGGEAGRHIHAVIPAYQGDLDETNREIVFGIYDIASERVHVTAGCGRFFGFSPRN